MSRSVRKGPFVDKNLKQKVDALNANHEKKVIKPKYVQATLVQLEEKPKPVVKPKPRPEPKPVAKPKPVVKPKPQQKAQPKPQPAAKPKPVPKPKPVEPVKAEPKQPKIDQKQLEKELASALASEEEFLLDQSDAQLASSYAAYMRGRIENNWSRPPSARLGMKVVLQIQLVPTGQLVSVTVLKSSGNSAFDRSAEQAVRKVGQFEKLQELPPRVFEANFRKLNLEFSPDDLRL